MKKLFKYLFYLIIASIFLSSCQSVQDGLSKKKGNKRDEFLVEKKNPLIVPPDSQELPKPSSSTDEEEEEINLKKIIKEGSGSKNISEDSQTSDSSLEKSIIEKIKKN